MNVRDLNAMAIVVSGDALLREQHRAFERYVEAEHEEKAVQVGPQEIRDAARQKVLDREAICFEFAALGMEC